MKLKIKESQKASQLWYQDHVGETFKIKKEFDDYYLLFYKQRIVFKEHATIITNENRLIA